MPRNKHQVDDQSISFRGDEIVAKRRERRKPKLKRTRKDLLAQPVATTDPAQRVGAEDEFSDGDMRFLQDRGYFDTLIGELKGGKEATVFLVGRGEERFAAKVYADIEARSFRDDRVYWQGFHVGDARMVKAMAQRSKAGLKAQQHIWVTREYHYLWLLHEAGIKVPKPAIGPEPYYYSQAGAVVLMEFVGEGDTPAPRLSDVRLSPEEGRLALDQAVTILRRLCRLGLVHGDFSTYNLLWHQGEVWLIDVPQMVQVGEARGSRALLERDVNSLLTTFRRHGAHLDQRELLRSLNADLE
ncbi:MAG: hypothetical protein KF813_07210 [Trueperaceae bacterium]|nr:hypothetical protein [Trueperaceae bacterium]